MKNASELKFPLYDVLKELFARVGQDIDTFDFSPYSTLADDPKANKPILCDAYEWTREEEEDFKSWFVDFFYNNAKARRKADCHIPKNKKYIEDKIWPWFMLDFSWKESKERK